LEKLNDALECYEKAFDDSFPMFSLRGTPPDEIVEIIRKCILEKKDVYDIGYLSLNEDTIY